MTLLDWVLALAVLGAVVLAHVLFLHRDESLKTQVARNLGAMGLAAAAVIPVVMLEHYVQAWAHIDLTARTGNSVALLMFSFLVVAPLEMGMITLSVYPFWRSRRRSLRSPIPREREIREAVALATSAAMGFAVVRNIAFLIYYASGHDSVFRVLLDVLSYTLLCALWGYVLGARATEGMRSRSFTSAWMLTTVFSAVCDQLILRRDSSALVAVIPLIITLAAIAFVLWRDTVRRGHDDRRPSSGRFSAALMNAPTPSLEAIGEAFRQRDRPLMFRWIVFGTLVTAGVITAGIAGAVILGHKIGVDFSAIDHLDSERSAAAPLALLSLGVLAAFPVAGYLLARASEARSVLEPATSSVVAMALLLFLMGSVAPTSLVFAVAVAPIAFGLSCAGAWVGISG